MNEILLLKGNPSRRHRKHRSRAQRAATRRMIAANRYRSNPAKKRRVKHRAATVTHRKHRVARFSTGNFMSLIKTGAIAGGGALAVDVGMGLIAKFMPNTPMLTSRINADGTINYGYYLTKGALAAALGIYGRRFIAAAPVMAQGAYTVMLYEVFRAFMPQDGTIPLGGVGWFNPGRVVAGGSNMARIMHTGKILPLNRGITTAATNSSGASAANILRSVNQSTPYAYTARNR